MEMDCFAPKAVQGQMVAQAMGRQLAQRSGGQFFSTSVEDLLNRIPVSSKDLVHPYVNRLVILCKDKDGKVGLRVRSVDKGVFVALVTKGSPSAMGGLRFGDQILQINGDNVAGYSESQVHKIFQKASVNNIVLAVRDRPFERSVTLHKDSTGHVGFQYKDGEIKAIVVGSSAARNGLLINHNMVEINGQNVVGISDKEVSEIIDSAGTVVTVTVLPSYIYRHMMKNMSSSLIKKMMDHSIPDM